MQGGLSSSMNCVNRWKPEESVREHNRGENVAPRFPQLTRGGNSSKSHVAYRSLHMKTKRFHEDGNSEIQVSEENEKLLAPEFKAAVYLRKTFVFYSVR